MDHRYTRQVVGQQVDAEIVCFRIRVDPSEQEEQTGDKVDPRKSEKIVGIT